MREDNGHFLRVDKHDFNRVLREVDSNMVHLREKGRDVLILEKICMVNRFQQNPQMQSFDPTGRQPQQPLVPHDYRYAVMAGTPEKMLEYLLETRVDLEMTWEQEETVIDDTRLRYKDTFYEDFILTHIIFLPTNVLGNLLKHYYQKGCSIKEHLDVGVYVNGYPIDEIQLLASKRRVVHFMYKWITMAGLAFFLDPVGNAFVEELYCAVMDDSQKYAGLHDLTAQMTELVNIKEGAMQICSRPPAVVLERGVYRADAPAPEPVMPFDIAVIDVHSADGKYVSLKTRLDLTAGQLRDKAGHRFTSGRAIDDMFLVEVKSNGEKVLYESNQVTVATMLGQNSRLFICFHDQIDSVVRLRNQCTFDAEALQNPVLDIFSPLDIAYTFMCLHWSLFSATHDFELLYYVGSHVLGRSKFPGRLPSNLDLLLRRFEEVKFWVTTEVVLCTSLSRRIQLITKFIKIAQQCKSYQDLLAFFAIVLGLSNIAVSRLHHTWQRLPLRVRRLFAEFESLLDPARNHRTYRLLIADMQSPVVPFVPLMVKDLTFTHENHKTYYNNLVNFEKMHIIAKTLRAFRRCKSQPLIAERPPLPDCEDLLRNLRTIDDARILMDLSVQIEPGAAY